MRSPYLHNLVSIVLSLSVAWHCIVGCCGHHSHVDSGRDSCNCGQSHDFSHHHATCDHECECASDSTVVADSASERVVTFLPESSSTSRCLGGKCAFMRGDNEPVVNTGSELACDFDCHFASHRAKCHLQAGKQSFAVRLPFKQGATSARPQQRLCVWLI
jgi:hypothetical protein